VYKRILIVICLLFLAGCRVAPERDTLHITVEQAVVVAGEAHALASEIFGGAFLLEVEGDEKPAWEDVRAMLSERWADDILDNSFEDFYNLYLWEWGYEIASIFPLQYTELIVEYNIVEWEDERILLKFVVGLYQIEEIYVELILEEGRWLLN